MSHSSGTVRFKDDVAYWFEYDGTSDVCIPQLYKTYKEHVDNWRNGAWIKCTCGKDEDATIHADYGGGFSWEGKACRHCMCILEGYLIYPPWKETL